jgi:hypothetical protein
VNGGFLEFLALMLLFIHTGKVWMVLKQKHGMKNKHSCKISLNVWTKRVICFLLRFKPSLHEAADLDLHNGHTHDYKPIWLTKAFVKSSWHSLQIGGLDIWQSFYMFAARNMIPVSSLHTIWSQSVACTQYDPSQ